MCRVWLQFVSTGKHDESARGSFYISLDAGTSLFDWGVLLHSSKNEGKWNLLTLVAGSVPVRSVGHVLRDNIACNCNCHPCAYAGRGTFIVRPLRGIV